MNRRDFFKTAAVGTAALIGVTVVRTEPAVAEAGEFGLSHAMRPDVLQAQRDLNVEYRALLRKRILYPPVLIEADGSFDMQRNADFRREDYAQCVAALKALG